MEEEKKETSQLRENSSAKEVHVNPSPEVLSFLERHLKENPDGEGDQAPEDVDRPARTEMPDNQFTSAKAAETSRGLQDADGILPRIKVKLTESDREEMLDAVMEGRLCELHTDAGKGKFRTKMRDLSVYELSMCICTAWLDMEPAKVPIANVVLSRIQDYMLALSTLEIGGRPLERVSLNPDDGFEKSAEILQELGRKRVLSESRLKWSLWFTCLRKFQEKIRLMREELVNDEDFSSPAD